MWATDDAAGVEEIVAQPDRWNDVFDETSARALWTEATSGGEATKHEAVLQRLIWRATYNEHLAVLARAGRADSPDSQRVVPSADGRWIHMRSPGRPDLPQGS